MSELLRLCRESVAATEGGLACGAYSLGGEVLALHLREPRVQGACDSFAHLALGLLRQATLDADGPVSSSAKGVLGEVNLAGEVDGYARLLPAKGVVVVMLLTPSSRVGMGWAALSGAAVAVESAL